MSKKYFGVIGLGTFGSNVARELSRRGMQVLALDSDEEKVKDIANEVTQALVVDATDEKELRNSGIADCDVVIVSVGENMETSILITLLLKELNVKQIIVKSLSPLHSRIAVKVGADRVIYPEYEMAKRLAESLTTPNILEEITLSPDYNIVEVVVPKKFVGKTIAEIDVRSRFGISIIAIRRKETVILDSGETDFKEETTISPSAMTELNEGDVLVVIGKQEDINKLTRE